MRAETGRQGGNDYWVALARYGRTHWWTAGMRAIGWAVLGEITGRVLDDGCGPGWMLTELPSGAWGVGIDRQTMPGPARPTAFGQPLPRPGRLHLAAAEAGRLPFPDASFEIVLALDLLEQRLVDPGQALAEARRVLALGGRLLARVPAYPWLFGPHDYYWGGTRRYRRAEFAELVEGAGFTIRRLTYANSLLFPLQAGARLLGRAGLLGGADLLPLPLPLNRLLAGVLATEARWLRRHNLPLGLSLICLAERP
jgi:SAM-dependent methyltransferase